MRAWVEIGVLLEHYRQRKREVSNQEPVDTNAR
jgi:hypothetical protein